MHRRAPRAPRRAFTSDEAARAGGACAPTGSSCGDEVPGFSAGADAVFEAPAFVSGLDDVTMMGEPVEKRRRHLGVAENARPFTESEIGRDEDQSAFIESADQVEEELAADLGRADSRVRRG